MPEPTQDRDDDRPDIQQAVEARADAAKNAQTDATPLEGAGGENGAGGVVKNQDGNQQ
ncbi:hypothetical protein ACNFJ7_02540 [Sphingomonas sp. HT-1]|uniref:hypothetical protein n=1 Tax=unclassified Sphingomonas TaxID=196159 RepID=UPI00030D3757|nr:MULTISPECIES: hypothetical protein [unclassified Sphingomonas]